MARARSQPWTIDDFLVFEAEEIDRYELVDGIVRMMTGGSAARGAIKGNVDARAGCCVAAMGQPASISASRW